MTPPKKTNSTTDVALALLGERVGDLRERVGNVNQDVRSLHEKLDRTEERTEGRLDALERGEAEGKGRRAVAMIVIPAMVSLLTAILVSILTARLPKSQMPSPNITVTVIPQARATTTRFVPIEDIVPVAIVRTENPSPRPSASQSPSPSSSPTPTMPPPVIEDPLFWLCWWLPRLLGVECPT